jgi:hypothetical protein
MPNVAELTPLSGYESSTPADINEKGQVVGVSSDPTPPTWLPPSRATLWADDKVIPLLKSPGPYWEDSSNLLPSEAMRLGWEGRILCAYSSTDKKSYYVWKNEAEPALDLATVVTGLKDAIDFNDKGQVLVTRHTGRPQILNLGGVGPTTTRTLPAFPGQDTLQYYPAALVGIDNAGRVVVWWPSKFLPFPSSIIAFWDPAQDDKWTMLTGTNPWFKPTLSRSGFLLVTTIDDSGGRPYFFELGTPQPKSIPMATAKPIGVYLDATSNGWLVGGEGSGGTDYTPTLYNQPSHKPS